MKNIHILPTDKPSRIYEDVDNDLQLGYDFIVRQGMLQNQNIYITNSEEIQEGDYFIAYSVTSEKKPFLSCASEYKERKKEKGKIILTTDQDLDGVQAIPDEFLEWFVKNPSCEEVEVADLWKEGSPNTHDSYQIIIPKEDSKQRLEKYSERFDNKDNEIVEGIFNPETWGKRLVNDVPKQETVFENAKLILRKHILKNKEQVIKDLDEMRKLSNEQEKLEEAIDGYVYKNSNKENLPDILTNAIRFGTKWQEQKTIEEVFEWLTTNNYLTDLKETLIENFKKR